jgi:hypothetical protein
MEKLIRKGRQKNSGEEPIILTVASKFPIHVILLSATGTKKEYKLVKTKTDKLLLN